jgi:hypothetical protein
VSTQLPAPPTDPWASNFNVDRSCGLFRFDRRDNIIQRPMSHVGTILSKENTAHMMHDNGSIILGNYDKHPMKFNFTNDGLVVPSLKEAVAQSFPGDAQSFFRRRGISSLYPVDGNHKYRHVPLNTFSVEKHLTKFVSSQLPSYRRSSPREDSDFHK